MSRCSHRVNAISVTPEAEIIAVKMLSEHNMGKPGKDPAVAPAA